MGMPFEVVSGGIKLNIHLQPGAKRTAFAGLYGQRLKVAVQAPPVDGKANKALQKLLAGWLEVAVSSVTLASGMTGREKQFLISGVSPEEAKEKLEKLL